MRKPGSFLFPEGVHADPVELRQAIRENPERYPKKTGCGGLGGRLETLSPINP